MRHLLRLLSLALSLLVLADTHAFAQSEQLRESWQHVPELFAAAGVRPGAFIADVGAGDGFTTVRLAPAVGPTGKVYAIDIDEKVMAGLRQRLATAHITNVEVVAGMETDPRLPTGALDGVMIINSYHEMPDGVTMLKHIFEALKPGAHLVLCEPTPRTPGQTRAVQANDHVIDPELVVQDVRAAGFQLLDRQDRFATNLGGTHFGLVVVKRP